MVRQYLEVKTELRTVVQQLDVFDPMLQHRYVYSYPVVQSPTVHARNENDGKSWRTFRTFCQPAGYDAGLAMATAS